MSHIPCDVVLPRGPSMVWWLPIGALAWTIGLALGGNGLVAPVPDSMSVVLVALAGTFGFVGERRCRRARALCGASLVLALLAMGVQRGDALLLPPVEVAATSQLFQEEAAPTRTVPADAVSVWVLRVQDGARPRVPPWNLTALAAPWSGSGYDYDGQLRPVLLRGVDGGRAPVRGDVLLVRAKWQPPSPALHAWTFDPAVWLRGRGLVGTLVVEAPPIWIADGEGIPTWPDRLRHRAERSLAVHLAGATLAIATAMVTGTRDATLAPVRSQFADNGAAHVLAVSGMHLALLIGVIHALLRALLRRVSWVTARHSAQQVAAVAVLPMIPLYVVATGSPASAVRAGLLTAAVLVGRCALRGPAPLHALAAAAWGMLLVRPAWLWDVGFQLSVCATAGLVAHGAWVARCELAYRQQSRATGWRGFWIARSRALTRSFLASVVASAATMPALLWHFGSLPVLSPWTNLVVVPPLALVVFPGAALLCVVDPWWPQAAGLLAMGVHAACAFALDLAGALAAGLSTAYTPGRPSVWQLPWLGVLALGTVWLHPVSLRRWLLVTLFGLAGWAATPATGPRPDWLVVDAIPVGQGDATLLRHAGATMLVDAGPPGFPAQGLLGWLRGHGVGRVDVLVISHADADHVGGLEALAGRIEIGEVWISDAGWRRLGTMPYAELLQEHGTRLRLLGPGDRTERWGDAWIRLLPPTPADLTAGNGEQGSSHVPDGHADVVDENETSLVLAVHLGRHGVWLTGDIGTPRESALVARGRVGPLSVLKVAHHGSATSTSERFLLAAQPAVALVSSGEGNHYGHPSPAVLMRLQDAGVRVLDTHGGCSPQVQTDGTDLWFSAGCRAQVSRSQSP